MSTPKMLLAIAALIAGATTASGCIDTTRSPANGGTADAGPSDTGPPDVAPPDVVTGDCSLGQTRCNGQAFEICVGNQWLSEAVCPQEFSCEPTQGCVGDLPCSPGCVDSFTFESCQGLLECPPSQGCAIDGCYEDAQTGCRDLFDELLDCRAQPGVTQAGCAFAAVQDADDASREQLVLFAGCMCERGCLGDAGGSCDDAVGLASSFVMAPDIPSIGACAAESCPSEGSQCFFEGDSGSDSCLDMAECLEVCQWTDACWSRCADDTGETAQLNMVFLDMCLVQQCPTHDEDCERAAMGAHGGADDAPCLGLGEACDLLDWW